MSASTVSSALSSPVTTLTIEPVTPTIGAEISGCDLSGEIAPETRDAILEALVKHRVVFFRDQDMDHAQLTSFGRQFGTLTIGNLWKPVPGFPEISPIHADARSTSVAGEVWHSDMTCTPAPPMGSILHIKIVPPVGGDTLFANMVAAYEALSAPMQRYLEGLTASHSALRAVQMANPGAVQDEAVSVPSAVHPMIRTHPVTGEKLIFVNPFFTTHIVGVGDQESQAILNLLYAHCADPIFSLRFRWRPGSVAFWDNRSAQHRALKDYLPQTRSGFRVQIDGEPPH